MDIRREELLKLIRGGLTPKALEEQLSNYHENDIAGILEELERPERERLYRILSAGELADILEYGSTYLGELPLRKRAEVLALMDPDKAVDYLKGLERDKRGTLLSLLPEHVTEDILLLWPYEEDEIGSIMTTNYIEIRSGISVKEAMHELVRQAADNDNISTIYVVDENRTFYGAIDLKDLIIAREGTPLSDLTATSYPYVYAKESIEDCVEQIKQYSEDSVPVLDEQNKLLGVITAADFMRVVDDELGEDYAKLAGLSAEEDLNEPVRKSVLKRLPCCSSFSAWGSASPASWDSSRPWWPRSPSSSASSPSSWTWRETWEPSPWP